MTTPHNARTHYQTSFRIEPKHISRDDLFDRIITKIRGWIFEKEKTDKGIGLWFFEGGEWKSPPNSFTKIKVKTDQKKVKTDQKSESWSIISWSMFYQEADKEQPGKQFWYTDIGLHVLDESISFSLRISHGLNSEYIGEAPSPPTHSSPKIIRQLFEDSELNITTGKLQLKKDPIEISVGEEHILWDAIFNERFCSIIFINGEFDRESFPAHPEIIQGFVLGKSQVFYAKQNEELGKQLGRLIPQEYRCSYQTIRIYLPNPNRDYFRDSLRHRYFNKFSAEEIREKIFVHLRAFTNDDRSGVLTHSDIEARIRDRRLKELREAGTPNQEWIDMQNAKIEKLSKEKEDQKIEYEQIVGEGDLEIKKLEKEKEELKNKIHNLESKNQSLQSISKPVNSGESAYRESYLRILHEINPATPEDCLNSLLFLYPEKIRILNSAFVSAEDSERFKHVQRLWGLLCTLATKYFDEISNSSGGNSVAKEVFGDKSFSARESEAVESNSYLKKHRTFLDENKERTMFAHLKIGVKDSSIETIRVHFEWDKEEEKIIIGHCGPHLPLK